MSDYYTVTQFAKLYGKDSGNIRRMLLQGTLTGEKIGSQWLIPKTTAIPADRRVKSGAYRGWRKKTQLNSRHPALLKELRTLAASIGDLYAGAATQIVLYGSYARGEETAESDIDIAIFLTATQTAAQYDLLTDLLVDYELKLGVTLSVVPIEEQEFAQWKADMPFYRNIAGEGIVLWKKE